ncbi:MAG TPA: hypothetical protein VE861_16010 [Gemmatimonadaceae bacterium]|nr:hypothetical protein [Gemmatimonadaceae bacterium]
MAIGILSGTAQAQQPCAKLDTSWWQVGATRFFQSSGAGARLSAFALERHVVDRRTLRRNGGGYTLEIRRTKLGLRDETVDITVEFSATGAVTRITGDTASLQREVAPLLMLRCSDLSSGRTVADAGARIDTVRTDLQRSVTRTTPSRPTTVGSTLDTLGATLTIVTSQRTVGDTSTGSMLRRLPNQQADTVHPWTMLAGDETERQLVRPRDGAVVVRERIRKLTGRGWVPPHDMTDTVPIRVESASIERVVDSAMAAGILQFPRRGDVLLTASQRDTVALHYREWRGDTLIVRQVRRSGWRDELRTVWRDSSLVSASLLEPGTATQQPGPFRRPFRIERGFLFDAGVKDSSVATPTHPWGIALDGFEDALVPAMLAVPADAQPHRFSMYGIINERGTWLDWSVTIIPRGPVRVARFFTLQRQWVGTFIFTPAGELLLSSLGGADQLRIPAAGTRLDALLDAAKRSITREDLLPPQPAATKPGK